MRNHTDVLIPHTGICAGASQIPLMADANLRFAPPPSRKRSGMENIMKKSIGSFAGGKKKPALALAAAVSVLATACGSKEYLKDIKASDYVTLGNYIGIEASAEAPVVDENIVDSYIALYVLPMCEAEEVSGRAVEEGDTVNIDFVGYLDGEAFEGGSGSDYELTIGAHQFIDGFEDGLIGADIGDQVSLDLTFPDPYPANTDLSGAPVVFDVTINSISRKEITEEVVQSLGIEGCSTEEELRDALYNAFYENAVQNYENTIETTMVDTIMANSTFKEPPADMVDRFYQYIEELVGEQAAAQNVTLEVYMKNYFGMDKEAYEAEFKDEALKEAQQYILYQAIADAEGLNPTDEELQEQIDLRVEAGDYESEEAYKEENDAELLREQLMRDKVMEFIKENGVIETTEAVED